MHSKGDPVDVVTVAERSPEGWQDYEVLQLAGDTPSASNVVAYAEILLQAWKRRSVARVASALVSDMRGDADLDAASMAAVSKINEITASVQRSGPMSAKSALKGWFADFQRRAQSGETMTGLPTPWTEINALTYGLDPGRLYVIAGRPGAGKSVLGENLWSCTAMSGKRGSGIQNLVASLRECRCQQFDRRRNRPSGRLQSTTARTRQVCESCRTSSGKSRELSADIDGPAFAERR